MRTVKELGLLLFLVLSPPFPGLESCALAAAKLKAIRIGKLVDGSGKVWSGAVVMVKDDQIVTVGPGDSATPPDAEVIDLTRFTGIPGLIDVHTHMTYYWDGAAGYAALGATPRRGCLPSRSFWPRRTRAKPSKPASPRCAISGPPSTRISPCAT